jgi:hypothetical protein
MFADALNVYLYSGGIPTPIGVPLNEKGYTNAIIESDGRRFYVLIAHASSRKLYVYDLETKAWMPEDDLNIVGMTSLNHTVYALDSTGKIWAFNSGTEAVEWSAETKVFDDNYYGKKKIKNIKLRLKMSSGTSVTIYSRRNDGLWSEEHTVYNAINEDLYKMVRKVINLNRAERYQLKFVGTGDVLIYGEREFDIGSHV